MDGSMDGWMDGFFVKMLEVDPNFGNILREKAYFSQID